MENAAEKQMLWGHPRGLYTLFMTEFWERFSFYGMRALLVLFLIAEVESGGFGFTTEKAASIYGWYTSLVYMTAIVGGWVADRILGLYRAVFVGGIIIAAGHFCLAMGSVELFFVGLALIIIGTGLLKPNISSMVGTLYGKNDPKRDGGFSIFYMGINLGAFIAPLICGTLGQKYNWHYGFGAAGVGMLFGVLQFTWGRKYFSQERIDLKKDKVEEIEKAGKYKYTTEEKMKIAAICVFFIFSSLFWGAFEQAGSSLNIFADQLTRTSLFGFDFPSTWFQSLNPVFIIALSPVFAWAWVALGKKEPSSPAKFAFGLVFVGLGFFLLAFGAMFTGGGESLVSPLWLVGVYLLHTIGELCLSPVGLSMVTKLAPARLVGSMMGVWFLSISLGNKLGGIAAGFFETLPLPTLFGAVGLTTTVAAVVLVLVMKPIKKLMGDVH